eukprot:CAMPEP_0181240910 /NCGR_PEP_ID=MMETSP1096-20121128/40811_1 /TAXON_ID=156174 ORGANISM="Chrysochromulina ericina, Strain CCMP281" /NCGR_SAMPLE_ID=MMETSP1096 /ASSEMBLY_ACC=CAM_ASM_000453 /LENGTH=148 /DNA_ID=CAMNT_0023336889 /DNA_START=1 /DNA_END=448 /DNA_ORIENTATION=+
MPQQGQGQGQRGREWLQCDIRRSHGICLVECPTDTLKPISVAICEPRAFVKRGREGHVATALAPNAASTTASSVWADQLPLKSVGLQCLPSPSPVAAQNPTTPFSPTVRECGKRTTWRKRSETGIPQQLGSERQSIVSICRGGVLGYT